VPPREIYQLRVMLLEIEPPVWRRFQLRGTSTLATLHAILQDVMGWTNSHLYFFEIGEEDYEEPGPEAEGANARKTQLGQLGLRPGDRFDYLYDRGDNWRHEVLVEAVLSPVRDRDYPVCLDGARACPPEDCGGVPGYVSILEALENPTGPEFRETLEWLDGFYNPEVFDVRATNRILGLAHPDRRRK